MASSMTTPNAAVGACTAKTRELDATAVSRPRLYTDRRESAMAEAGDFLLARGEGAVTDEHLLGELGDVLEDKLPGRRSDEETLARHRRGGPRLGPLRLPKALKTGRGSWSSDSLEMRRTLMDCPQTAPVPC